MAGLYVNHEVTASRQLKVGILTVSDRCSAGLQEDKSGPNLKSLAQTHLHRLGAVNVITACVPDEVEVIKNCLYHWADVEKCILVLTTGGTGFSSRDVTPEATKEVIEREAPGFTIQMLTKSIATTPMAMLSRPVCGIRKKTIIVNLPGSRKGSQECFEFIVPALAHAFDLVTANVEKVAQTHDAMNQFKAPPVITSSPKSPRRQDPRHDQSDNVSDVLCLVQNCQGSKGVPHTHPNLTHHRSLERKHSNQSSHSCPGTINRSGGIGVGVGGGISVGGCNGHHSHRNSMESLQSNLSNRSYGSSSISSDQGYEHSYSSSESNHQCKCVYIDTPRVAERDRFSPYPMILVSKALSIVLSTVQVSKKRHLVNLHAGLLGKVLLEDIRAKEPYPPFAASVKDGYAVIASEGAGVKRVIEPITAGKAPNLSLRRGQCSRITTGAPIPMGADAVVQVEDTELVEAAENGNVEVSVRIKIGPAVMQDIRPVGFDIKQGETILTAGEKLGPAELGLLAMAGINMVSVYTPPTIGIFSTGDELVPPGTEKKPGQIYDSNKIALLTAIREQGYNAADLGTLPDNYLVLKDKMLNVIDDSTHQVIITTGGVSMGEKDLVKKFLAHFGEIKFGRLNMKPGKPTTFATITRGSKQTYIFALPGNPVSALVTFYLFVLPALRKLAGFKKPNLQRIQARLDFDIRLDSRPEYHRSRLNWDTDDGVPLACSTGSQCSSRLLSMRSCHALLELPSSDSVKQMTRGQIVTALLIPKLCT